MSDSESRTLSTASAELAVVRVISVVLAVTTMLFLALTVGSFPAQDSYVVAPWQSVAAFAIFGLPVAVALASVWSSLRTLRLMHGAYAIIFATVVLSWIPAFVHGPMPIDMAPWTVGMTALSTVPAAVAWRPPTAWGFLIASSLMIAPIRIIADGGADVSLALQFALFTVTICAVFTALAMVALDAGKEVDVATAAAQSSSARAAAVAGRAEEQAHLDGLVHDEVIATIFAAAGAGRSNFESTRAQAARTIARLRELQEATTSVPELVHSDHLVQSLVTSIGETTDSVEFVVTGSRSTPIPSAIASAFLEAAMEALRNSIVHASHDAKPVLRTVTLRLNSSSVAITITDDGRGFDLESVPSNRLGIVVSILGRVNTLPGAQATVWSRPGTGTRVSVRWCE